jgi:hypothetical protein
MTKIILWTSFAVAGLIPAAATPITYTISAIGSGTLNGTPFANATITFTQVGDTANVFTNPLPFICGAGVTCAGAESTNTVAISGVGTFTLTDETEFFDNSNGTAGFSDDTLFVDFLDEDNSAFDSYGLTTALGPIVDSISADTTGFTNEPTNAGSLTISSFSGQATFQAVPGSSVPEPANLLLMGTGLLALLFRRKPAQSRFDVAAGTSRLLVLYSARTLWTNCTAIEPSPTAAATRFMLPDRTSPTANTPGRLVSSR